jgi:hypothetical protein
MDLWSDDQLTAFMAVTAHWIEAKLEHPASGPQHVLHLWCDLIGFLRVPGHHDGAHLAHAFIHITDRIGITENVCCLIFASSHMYLTFTYLAWLDNT